MRAILSLILTRPWTAEYFYFCNNSLTLINPAIRQGFLSHQKNAVMKLPVRTISSALSFFILFEVTAQKNKPEKDFNSLDTTFSRVMKEWHAAGFAVGIVEKNKVLYAKGFGYRDYENKLPVTPNTLFAIGSCTKAFTASLLGLLNKEDKVDFDKPVRSYLPELQFYNDGMNDKITLRDMMSHRTGLPRHDYSWYFFVTKSRDSLMQRVQYMEPTAGLREKWQYNNFMFMLQGLVAEKITGKSWEDNIRSKFFLPLEMKSSVVSTDEVLKSPEAALGYGLKKDSLIHKMEYYPIDAMAPAGSISSSVNDMANWVTTWIEGGKYKGKEILPASYTAQAMGSQMVIGPGLPEKEKPDLFLSNYGLGWFLSSYRGHYRVEHGGNIDGFSASTCFFPSDSIGIIVLCNQNNSTLPLVVRNILADKMLGLKYFDWETDLLKSANKAKAAASEAEKNKISSRKTGTKPSHEMKDFSGIYLNKAYGGIEINFQNDSLFALIGKHIWWLRPYHYDMFEPFEKDPKEGIDTSEKSNLLQFQMNRAGDMESLFIDFEPSLKPIVFTKTPRPKEISKDSLEKYVADYDLSSVVIKVFMKGDKTLFLFVPGQPEYELVPVEKDKFSIKILNGYTIQFNRNVEGHIIELLSIQPNGTFKAMRKK
jgi:CubicO group peptidase (beta-lactamase class C family)